MVFMKTLTLYKNKLSKFPKRQNQCITLMKDLQLFLYRGQIVTKFFHVSGGFVKGLITSNYAQWPLNQFRQSLRLNCFFSMIRSQDLEQSLNYIGASGCVCTEQEQGTISYAFEFHQSS